MPDRCDRRCSTVTPSSISGRSLPSTERAGRRELEHAFLDQAHDGERGEALRPARDPEPRVDRVRDLEAAMREAVRPRQLDLVASVDSDDTRELRLGREGVELVSVVRHRLGSEHARAARGGRASRVLHHNRAMQVFLETERLLLRRFTEDDLDNLVELDSDPEVMRFITGGRPTPREEVENEILPAFLDHYERYAGYGFWAAVEKSTRGDSSVGSTSVRPTELHRAKSSSATAYADPPGARATPPKAREH